METSERTVSTAPAPDPSPGRAAVTVDDPSSVQWRQTPRPTATTPAQPSHRAGDKEASRTRLLGALVVWDALLPVALLPICAQLEGSGARSTAAPRAPSITLALFLALDLGPRPRDRRRLPAPPPPRGQPPPLRPAPARAGHGALLALDHRLGRRRMAGRPLADGRPGRAPARRLAARPLGLRPPPGHRRRARPARRIGRGRPPRHPTSPTATATTTSPWSGASTATPIPPPGGRATRRSWAISTTWRASCARTGWIA